MKVAIDIILLNEGSYGKVNPSFARQCAIGRMLKISDSAKGIVLFAHGSGSSRLSPRNNFVADVLNKGGLATLLIDLLSKEEDADYQMRFNIQLLTRRLETVVDWLQQRRFTLLFLEAVVPI